jgi:excisionase family DNA binding protein
MQSVIHIWKSDLNDFWWGAQLVESFTPKQVATALRVSESSVKRWCDRGVIRTDRTLGGHRRIPLEFLLEFLETTNRRIVDPAAIGLEAVVALNEKNEPVQSDESSIRESFEKALMEGDEATCRKIMSAWYALHGGIASIADKLMSPTFRSIGGKWECGDAEIYQERRACELCGRLVHELRRLLPEPHGNSPLAMGGTPSGDQYQLPTQMVEMVFREYGWRTIALGSNIPFASLLSAARKHMPKVFWLSVSFIDDSERFLSEFEHFSNALPKGIMLVVGGRALVEDVRQKMAFSSYCDNLLQLSALARSARGATLLQRPQI